MKIQVIAVPALAIMFAAPAPVPANADVTCNADNQGRNTAAPEFYQEQYSAGLVKLLKKDLSVYDSAVVANDAKQIGSAAGTLYSEVSADLQMTTGQTLFGCYSPTVQTGLQNATNAWAPTLDTMACAGANTCGHTTSEMPGLVAQSKPQERVYINALNAYASQFGGEQIPLV